MTLRIIRDLTYTSMTQREYLMLFNTGDKNSALHSADYVMTHCGLFFLYHIVVAQNGIFPVITASNMFSTEGVK